MPARQRRNLAHGWRVKGSKMMAKLWMLEEDYRWRWQHEKIIWSWRRVRKREGGKQGACPLRAASILLAETSVADSSYALRGATGSCD